MPPPPPKRHRPNSKNKNKIQKKNQIKKPRKNTQKKRKKMRRSGKAAEPSEIAFFDVETTVPARRGDGYALLEFGAILVCPQRLVEVGSFSTLICPSDLDRISPTSVRCNGITRETVANAPSFREIADQVFDVLDGRVWVGHNIDKFDCARIREAFAEIGRPAPEPRGTIDTYPLLKQRFGTRAGNMKMATLASYFGLGQQKHRSLDDVRMNLDVLKHCASVLFLESIMQGASTQNRWVCGNTSPRNQDDRNAHSKGANPNLNFADGIGSNQCLNGKTAAEICDDDEPNTLLDPLDLMTHISQMCIDSSGINVAESSGTRAEGSSSHAEYLEPSEVSMDCISASQIFPHRFGRRINLLHKNAPLRLCCQGLKVHFGINNKFFDVAGRPKFNIVVDIPAVLCQVLDVCDSLAQTYFLDIGSSSEWKPVIRKDGNTNSMTIRLHIPTGANGDSTEIYKKEPSGDIQEFDLDDNSAKLEYLFIPGTITDAYFDLDTYDYQGSAGIRLVAKILVIHST